MKFFTKREAEENELTGDAQAFLNRIGHGKTEAEAAAELGVEEEELRLWRRKPVFRAEVKRAKREGPREPKLWVFDDAGNLVTPGEIPAELGGGLFTAGVMMMLGFPGDFIVMLLLAAIAGGANASLGRLIWRTTA